MTQRVTMVWIAVALSPFVFAGCSFDPHGILNLDSLLPWRDDVPFVVPTSHSIGLVFAAPDLEVHHGQTCAKGEKTLKVHEELAIPRRHDRGTVLLNGWWLRFADEETWVKGMGTGIGSITIDRDLLSWDAAGEISDGSEGDVVEWCYNFTTITWSSATLAATVDDGDTMHVFQDQAWNRGTALRPMPGFLRNPAFAGSPQVAVLPRGFIGMWDGDSNQLLHIAYHQDAGERFVEADKTYGNGEVPQPGPSSSAAGDVVTWESMGFIKNDDLEWTQTFAELVTAFAGNDVGVINPPFNVTPQEDYGIGCSSLGSPGIDSQERIVEGVPFQFAVPVLSGWDLSYSCNDENVRQIGAWIPKWSWTPGPAGGTLRYTVSTVLEKDDHLPFFLSRSQIKILGFRRMQPR